MTSSAFTMGTALSPSVSGNDATYTNVPKGFYGLKFTSDSAGATITYSSAYFTCPYDLTFVDSKKVFFFCRHLVNVHQVLALQAHQCGTRQFYNGSCNNVS